MTGWVTLRLEDCARIVGGSTPSTSVKKFWGDEFAWATPKDLSDLDGPLLSSTARRISADGLTSCGAEVLPAGSVLFSSRAPIGLVAVNTIPTATNQGFKSFVPNRERLDAKFLFHWLRHKRPQLEGMGNGATFKELSKAAMSRIEISLPPLPEQRRIAAILDHAEALRAKRRQSLARLDALTQSIFIEMFGDPLANPMNWPIEPFGNQISSIRYGTGSPPTYIEGGVAFIRATDIKNGVVELAGMKSVSAQDADKLRRCRVSAGNLILVRSGVNAGDCAIVPGSLDAALAAYDLVVELDHASAVFYNHLINSAVGKRILYPLTRRAAQPHLNAHQVENVKLISPPRELRSAFAKELDFVARTRSLAACSGVGLNPLFASLQHRAFRGEL